ncbi:hypothetical protein BaRGS_00020428 [Batillaria attramentaria]|uniref:Uncharacterized protein n=1 Tax=Batillaria attramentaria TaxID=370345 RepID=A0ABD0KMC8_9CAEN
MPGSTGTTTSVGDADEGKPQTMHINVYGPVKQINAPETNKIEKTTTHATNLPVVEQGYRDEPCAAEETKNTLHENDEWSLTSPSPPYTPYYQAGVHDQPHPTSVHNPPRGSGPASSSTRQPCPTFDQVNPQERPVSLFQTEPCICESRRVTRSMSGRTCSRCGRTFEQPDDRSAASSPTGLNRPASCTRQPSSASALGEATGRRVSDGSGNTQIHYNYNFTLNGDVKYLMVGESNEINKTTIPPVDEQGYQDEPRTGEETGNRRQEDDEESLSSEIHSAFGELSHGVSETPDTPPPDEGHGGSLYFPSDHEAHFTELKTPITQDRRNHTRSYGSRGFRGSHGRQTPPREGQRDRAFVEDPNYTRSRAAWGRYHDTQVKEPIPAEED